MVVVVSGKRKVGKDFLCERLLALLGPATAEIGRLSAPLKQAYALEHGLDYEELLTDGPYKEKYRKDMIAWGERRREKDPGFFAQLVMGDVTKS
jgi:phosphomevalonate kinase